MVVFSHVFQVNQFILNLQIHNLLMLSYKHLEEVSRGGNVWVIITDNGTNFFRGYCRNEQGIFRNEPQENQRVYEHGGRYIQWKFMIMVVDGSSGRRIVLLLAIWEDCGSSK